MSTCTHAYPAHPLHAAVTGRPLQLERLTGRPDVTAHLASLGFVPGTNLTIVSSSTSGPLIVALKDGRMMISRDMARNIWVR